MHPILKKFSSFKTSIILLAILIVLLAGATVIERFQGPSSARDMIYHSPILFLVLILLAVNFFLHAWSNGYLSLKRVGLVLTHTSFVLLMAGAAITHFTSVEGIIHLREGEMTDNMLVSGSASHQLPFTICLDDFILKRYPGSGSPSSYESFVSIYSGTEEQKAHIFMNNVLDIHGYRLYQASFDHDEQGSTLSVSRDSFGRSITYTGYFILFAGLLLSLTGRNGRFRQLYRRLGTIKPHAFILAFALSASLHSAEATERYYISEDHASIFGSLAVQSADGRMMPVNTFSTDVLRKLCKEDEVNGMNPDQFLLSLILAPDHWSQVPCISVSSKELASRYGLDIPHSSYIQLFDDTGCYKLQKEVEAIYRKDPSERTRTEKEVLKLDERVNIFSMLASRRLLNIFPLPEDSNRTWYAPGDDLSAFVGKDSMFVSRIFDWYLEEVATAADTGDWEQADKVAGMIGTYQQAKATGVDISRKKMETEVLYNRMNIFLICRIIYLLAGALSLLISLMAIFGSTKAGGMNIVPVCLVILSFLLHTCGMGMRWYIGGHAPWTNSYETMVYVSWATVLAGFVFLKRNRIVFSLASVFGGIILFVSSMIWNDPQVTNLVPVLKSPWLTFHVAVIVASYGFLGLSCLVGATNLLFMSSPSYGSGRLSKLVQEMSILNEMSLWIGLVLLTIGTFLGAIWADVSWGRYWGWDPKETWALITILVYTAVTHIHMIKGNNRLWLFNLLSVIAFLSVLMTFLGVNYLMSGMHSYN